MQTQQSELRPLVVPAGTGPFVDLGDHRGFVTVSAQSTGGAFSLFDLEADPGAGVGLHIHAREDETFYIKEGYVEFEVGGETIVAGPGDCVFAPRNITHAWRCVGPEKARGLLLITPGDNFEAFGIEMAQSGITPSDPGAAEALAALAARYGIMMLPSIK